MIDIETSRIGVSALATAIGELMEDTVEMALVAPKGGLQGYRKVSSILGGVGADIAVLASAIAILERRSERAE